MCTYEFFPKNYNVFRRYRNVNGGGVTVATSDLDTDCEMIWAGLRFSGPKLFYLASLYDPPSTTSQPLETHASSNNKLMTLHRRSPSNINIGGDFNLPGIVLETWQSGRTNESQHEVFPDFLLGNSHSQLIPQTTRPTTNGILDLPITSSPNRIENIETVPDMSDHLAMIFDVNI